MGVKRSPVGISLGSITRFFPRDSIEQVLRETRSESIRRRELPADVMVYAVIAFGLYLSEGCRSVLRRVMRRKRDPWLDELEDVVSESAISQARTRLGIKPVRAIYERFVGPIATRETRGAWFRKRRIVTMDGTTLDVADTPENVRAFHRPGVSSGSAAYPQVRIVALLENATHVLFGAVIGHCHTNEIPLAWKAIAQLPADAICLADRMFYSFRLWVEACKTGAALLWRVKNNMILDVSNKLADGSYLTTIYPNTKARRDGVDGIPVRLIRFEVRTKTTSEEYRLLCSILDPRKAPAKELMHLYTQRWTIETAFDELKARLRGRAVVLRSKTPLHVRQEIYGILMAYYGIRALMHEAALLEDIDPSDLSFVHTMRVVQRYIPLYVSFSPAIDEIALT
jgi:hypothetical protein